MESKLHSFDEKLVEMLACNACPCRAEATQVVPPIFNRDKLPEIVFIGRNPGKDEDEKGIPFVGPQGNLFNSMLDEVGLERNDVYITNTLKCHTVSDRPPKWTEALICAKWLYWELTWLKPKLIVTLGNDAARILCGKDYKSVTYTHGSTLWHDRLNCLVFLSHHPGMLARKPKLMSEVWMDDLPRLKQLVIQCKQGIDLSGVGVSLPQGRQQESSPVLPPAPSFSGGD